MVAGQGDRLQEPDGIDAVAASASVRQNGAADDIAYRAARRGWSLRHRRRESVAPAWRHFNLWAGCSRPTCCDRRIIAAENPQ